MAVVSEMLELHTGDRMDRQEFHRIYEKMPPGFKAELIGGVVYVASPLRRKHGTHHVALGTVYTRLLTTLNQGLASAEHKAFVRRLEAAGKTRRGAGSKRKRS